MGKYSFLDDYSEGCHPEILTVLSQINFQQHPAYGLDSYSSEAKKYILAKLDNPESEIFFVSGGTQANLTVTAASLRPHEAVIAADTGHIIHWEAGALEATGHKIIAMPANHGKLDPGILQTALDAHTTLPHVVKPKLVYISNATEVGTIYTRKELAELRKFCDQNELYLFLDGARLGPALCSRKNDLELSDLPNLTDAFTIGGTKNGALIGETIVLNNSKLKADFAIHLKQRGALLAKGWLLGIQFMELFRDDLYFELARHANRMAEKLSRSFAGKGYALSEGTLTNQVFIILPDPLINKLEQKFSFHVWARHDEHHCVARFVTSWATTEDSVEEIIDFLSAHS